MKPTLNNESRKVQFREYFRENNSTFKKVEKFNFTNFSVKSISRKVAQQNTFQDFFFRESKFKEKK